MRQQAGGHLHEVRDDALVPQEVNVPRLAGDLRGIHVRMSAARMCDTSASGRPFDSTVFVAGFC